MFSEGLELWLFPAEIFITYRLKGLALVATGLARVRLIGHRESDLGCVCKLRVGCLHIVRVRRTWKRRVQLLGWLGLARVCLRGHGGARGAALPIALRRYRLHFGFI